VETAKKKVKLFTGCVIPNRLPFLEKSARIVFEKLGIDLENAPFTCCPDPVGVASLSEKTWLTLAARNLSLSEKDNVEILSLCNGCTVTLLMVKQVLQHDKKRLKEVKEILNKKGYNYEGNVKVNHFVKMLVEDIGIKRIKNLVKTTWDDNGNKRNPVEDLKIASHAGCHYNKPSEILQWDDPDNPQYLDKLIKAIGAIPVKYEENTLCCGSAAYRTKKEILYEICRRKYQSVTEAGAQLIAVNCPTCFRTFESNQRTVNKIYQQNYTIPIFYITELMALAFGYKPDELGIKFHTVGKEMDFLKEF